MYFMYFIRFYQVGDVPCVTYCNICNMIEFIYLLYLFFWITIHIFMVLTHAFCFPLHRRTWSVQHASTAHQHFRSSGSCAWCICSGVMVECTIYWIIYTFIIQIYLDIFRHFRRFRLYFFNTDILLYLYSTCSIC